jgi:hypothetical protein
MKMRRNALIVALFFALLPAAARGQQQAPADPATTQGDIYCSGMVSSSPVARSGEIVSGEQAMYRATFEQGDMVYLDEGANKGVKVGDVFLAMRPLNDDNDFAWFEAQPKLLHAMGQMWADEGRLKVLVVNQNTSIAQITNSCDYMQRGDVVQPFEERPVPELKSEQSFDRFAPSSGKRKAMVVTGKAYRSTAGDHDVVYVNLGSNQGVKVGDYFRIFRYQDNGDSNAFQSPKMGTEVWGYGAAPAHYSWKELPREVLGEGVVLRASPNASTVLITLSLREIYAGDYCELE